jgi:hypothetical protein
MIRRMLSEQTWLDLFQLFDAVEGDGPALVRVARKSLPAHALGFVPGGVS